MALTIDSKVKDLASNPRAVEICKKHGVDLTDKRIKMAFGVTVRALSKFPAAGITPEILEALGSDLAAANIE